MEVSGDGCNVEYVLKKLANQKFHVHVFFPKLFGVTFITHRGLTLMVVHLPFTSRIHNQTGEYGNVCVVAQIVHIVFLIFDILLNILNNGCISRYFHHLFSHFLLFLHLSLALQILEVVGVYVYFYPFLGGISLICSK